MLPLVVLVSVVSVPIVTGSAYVWEMSVVIPLPLIAVVPAASVVRFLSFTRLPMAALNVVAPAVLIVNENVLSPARTRSHRRRST